MEVSNEVSHVICGVIAVQQCPGGYLCLPSERLSRPWREVRGSPGSVPTHGYGQESSAAQQQSHCASRNRFIKRWRKISVGAVLQKEGWLRGRLHYRFEWRHRRVDCNCGRVTPHICCYAERNRCFR